MVFFGETKKDAARVTRPARRPARAKERIELHVGHCGGHRAFINSSGLRRFFRMLAEFFAPPNFTGSRTGDNRPRGHAPDPSDLGSIDYDLRSSGLRSRA